MRTIDTFVFILWENKLKDGNWIKIMKENKQDLNGIKEIFCIDSINIQTFRIFTDLTNDWYALVEGTEGKFYQLNAFVILAPFLKVKQIDLQFENENPNIIEEMEIDKRIKDQVMETLKYSKELYKAHILDFIQVTIYTDPFTICKFCKL